MQTIRDMAAAFIIEDSKLLLVHNIKHGLRIEPPGGKVQAGESFEDCAVREVCEELGIEVEIIDLFSTHDIETPEGPFHVELYRCRILSGTPQKDLEPGKIGGFEWYTYEELENLANEKTLVPDVVEALPKLKSLLY